MYGTAKDVCLKLRRTILYLPTYNVRFEIIVECQKTKQFTISILDYLHLALCVEVGY